MGRRITPVTRRGRERWVGRLVRGNGPGQRFQANRGADEVGRAFSGETRPMGRPRSCPKASKAIRRLYLSGRAETRAMIHESVGCPIVPKPGEPTGRQLGGKDPEGSPAIVGRDVSMCSGFDRRPESDVTGQDASRPRPAQGQYNGGGRGGVRRAPGAPWRNLRVLYQVAPRYEKAVPPCLGTHRGPLAGQGRQGWRPRNEYTSRGGGERGRADGRANGRRGPGDGPNHLFAAVTEW